MNMKIQNLQSQQSFKGYKNILSHSFEEKDGMSHSFMAMKLDNEGGYRDLEKWHSIQKFLRPEATPRDYIVFQNSSFPNADFFTVDDFFMNINDESIDELSKEEESNIIKTNALVASLTKRIMYTDDHPEDENLHKTFKAAYDVLKPILGEKKAINFLTFEAAIKKVKHHITAKLINDGISRNMAKYFKIV